jgi:hypothetical protein
LSQRRLWAAAIIIASDFVEYGIVLARVSRKNNRSFVGFDDGTHHRLRRPGTLSRRPAEADFGDRGERVSNSQPASLQNKQNKQPLSIA